MMSRINQFFTLKKIYTDPLTIQRATGLLYFLVGLTVIFLLGSIYELVSIIQGPEDFVLVELLIFAVPILNILFIQLVRSGYYRQAAIGIVIATVLGIVSSIYTINNFVALFLVIPILIASGLLGWRSTIITFGVIFVLVLISSFASEGTDNFNDFIWTSLALTIITLWLIILGTNIQSTARRFIREFADLQRVTQRIQFGKRDASEDEIAFEAINLIRDQLNFTFASIYLVGDGGRVKHILGGLNLDQINIEHNVHLQLGNGISEAIRTESTIQIDSSSSSVLREHLLQGTLAALAIPIIKDSKVIGVVDVQSEDVEAFTENEIDTTALIATSLAIAITQARLITSLQKAVKEQEQLLTQQRTRLLNYERSEQRSTTRAWGSYLQERGTHYMGFDWVDRDIDTTLKDSMNQDLETALRAGDITVVDDGDVQVIQIPITLRGQSLGAMSFRVQKGAQAIGIRQQELIRSVVQRLALALENKRLFEQSQAQAQRESKANEVGSLLLSTTDIDTVLQLAADNFKDALGAIQTQIHLRPEASQIIEGEDRSS